MPATLKLMMEPIFDGGKALVERITALDRSTAPPADQIGEALSLVGLKLPADGQLFSYDLSTDKSLFTYNSLDEWTLRWLLKRLHSKNVETESLCVRYEAWLLLAQLVARLPIKVIARLFQGSLLSLTILRTFEWLIISSKNGDQTPEEHLQSEKRVNQKTTVYRAEREGEKKTRKRKRNTEITPDLQDHAVLTEVADTPRLLFAIAFAVKILETKISENLTGNGAFAAQHIRASIQCSSETATKILGSCSQCVSQSMGSSSDGSFIPNVFEAVIEPFLVTWQHRVTSMDTDPVVSEAVSSSPRSEKPC